MAVTYYVALPFVRTEEGVVPGLPHVPDMVDRDCVRSAAALPS
jgi:hypothetical protein